MGNDNIKYYCIVYGFEEPDACVVGPKETPLDAFLAYIDHHLNWQPNRKAQFQADVIMLELHPDGQITIYNDKAESFLSMAALLNVNQCENCELWWVTEITEHFFCPDCLGEEKFDIVHACAVCGGHFEAEVEDWPICPDCAKRSQPP